MAGSKHPDVVSGQLADFSPASMIGYQYKTSTVSRQLRALIVLSISGLKTE